MKTIKKTVAILVIAMVTMAFTNKTVETNKPVETKTYYYYAYADKGEYDNKYDRVWITSLKKITINTSDYQPLDHNAISLQFGDYMEANFKGTFFTNADVYVTSSFSEADATKGYRATLKRYDNITKIYDFSYKKERR